MTSFLPVLAFLSILFMLSACGGSTETLALQDPILVPVTPPAPVPPIDEPTNPDIDVSNIKALFDTTTVGESASRFVRDDGVLVTRIVDRGRDRHAKAITIQDHY